MNGLNLYQILQVPEAASSEAITTVYRGLCKRYHPDVYPDQELATVRMQELNAAIEVLGDERKRRIYDRRHGLGRYQRHGPVACVMPPPVGRAPVCANPPSRAGRAGIVLTMLMVLVVSGGVFTFCWNRQTGAADPESKVVSVETALGELIQVGWKQNHHAFLLAEFGPFDTVYLPAQESTNETALIRSSRQLVSLVNSLHWQNRTVAVERINAALIDYNARRHPLLYRCTAPAAPSETPIQWRIWNLRSLTYQVFLPAALAMLAAYGICQLPRWLAAMWRRAGSEI